MALHKGLADGLFAALVGPGGVEVGEAGVEEHVDHLLGLLDVDPALLALCLGQQLRQAHKAKAELFDARAELGLGCVDGHCCSLPSPVGPPLAVRVHDKRIAWTTSANQAGESQQTKTPGQLGDRACLWACRGRNVAMALPARGTIVLVQIVHFVYIYD